MCTPLVIFFPQVCICSLACIHSIPNQVCMAPWTIIILYMYVYMYIDVHICMYIYVHILQNDAGTLLFLQLGSIEKKKKEI